MDPVSLSLAIFPIAVQGLLCLVEAVGTVSTLRRYHRELKRYARDVESESTVFRLSIEQLISDIGCSQEDAAQLLDSPEAEHWDDVQLEERLKEYLHHSYDAYIHNMEDLLESLELICEKLSINIDTKEVQPVGFFRKEALRFKVAFSKDTYTEIFDRIRRANDFLRRTTLQNQALQSWRLKGKPYLQGTALARLREHAHGLHSCLAHPQHWQCTCHQHRLVNLHLNELEDSLSLSKGQAVAFEIAITSTSTDRTAVVQRVDNDTWQFLRAQSDEIRDANIHVSKAGKPAYGKPATKVRFQPDEVQIEEHLDDDNSQQKLIVDLCAAVNDSSVMAVQDTEYVGNLGLKDSASHRYRLFRIPQPWTGNTQAESLEKILSRLRSVDPIKDGAVLSHRSRLVLAAQLALSVLVLDGSWMKAPWSSKDVLLIKNTVRKRPGQRAMHKEEVLLLPWNVDALPSKVTGTMLEANVLKSFGIRSAALFALGITLIELSLGATFEDLRQAQDSNPDEMVSKRMTADRLLPRVEEASGDTYMQVVERCLDCPFVVDRRDVTFDNVKFQELVYEHVVKPLREIVAVMTGGH